MARRTRTFLLDNTVGKIFTNVQTTSSAGADKLIAGTKLLVKTLASPLRVQAIPTLNLGGDSYTYFNCGTGFGLIMKTD